MANHFPIFGWSLRFRFSHLNRAEHTRRGVDRLGRVDNGIVGDNNIELAGPSVQAQVGTRRWQPETAWRWKRKRFSTVLLFPIYTAPINVNHKHKNFNYLQATNAGDPAGIVVWSFLTIHLKRLKSDYFWAKPRAHGRRLDGWLSECFDTS